MFNYLTNSTAYVNPPASSLIILYWFHCNPWHWIVLTSAPYAILFFLHTLSLTASELLLTIFLNLVTSLPFLFLSPIFHSLKFPLSSSGSSSLWSFVVDVNWLIGMLLVSRFGLVEDNDVLFSFQGKQWGDIPVSFPHLRAVGQLVVHPPSRIVSHTKDKKLPWPLIAHPPSDKA